MRQQRFTLQIEARDSKTMEILGTLSTENPVNRGQYQEVLLHEKGAIDLSRGDLPLLEGHDASKINIGIVHKLQIVGRKLKGILKFGSSARAREIWADIEAKIIRGLSIGYEILEQEATGRDSVLVTKWRPMEVSLVPIPADTGAVIGRNRNMEDINFAELTLEQLEQLTEQKRKSMIMRPEPQDYKKMFEKDVGFRSFGEYLQAVSEAGRPGGSIDHRLTRAATGLQEAVGSEGGFLLSEQYSQDIFKIAHDSGEILSRVRKMTLTSAVSIKIPAIDEVSRASTRLGGLVGYWLSEADEKQKSKPKFRQMEFQPDKVVVLCYATDELLQDASMLESIIRQGFAEEITFQVEDAIVSGDGIGKPLGLLNSPSLITASKEVGQPADTFLFENAVAMWMRLHPSCRRDAVWLISPDLEGQIWQFTLAVGAGGTSVYMASAADSPYSTLFGRPIIPTELCSAKGDLGDVILFSPSQYLIVDKGTTQVDMSIHIRFLFDESVFRGVYRCAGMSLWHSDITPANSSATQSNIVTLEAR